MIDVAETVAHFDALKTARGTWESHWQELGDYVLPGRGQINVTRTPGEKLRNKIFDSTAVEANELLASGLHGMLTSPNDTWFWLTLADRKLASRRDVGDWLANATQRMHDVFNRSNFQTEIHENYLDLGAFGTAVLYIEEDAEKVVRFDARPLAECFTVENAFGQVDAVYRRFDFTASQAEQRGWNLSPRMRKALADKQFDQKFTILHVTAPRHVRDPRRATGDNMPFVSAYIAADEKFVLAEGGYQEFPYCVPRWTKAAGEAYGRSPAMKALADIKMLNEMSKTTLRAAQKAVDPPLMVADDGVLLPVRTTPSSLNYARFLADGGDPIRPLHTGADIGLGLEMENQRRESIRNAFFFAQMQLREGPQMTATEVLQRTEESLRLMGPILGRQHFELLRPLIDRTFAIMFRAGEFGEPPAAVRETRLDVEYISPIAKAQKATQAIGLVRALETASPLINFKPEILDNIDEDKALRHLMDLYSVPVSLLRDTAQVKRMRAAREQAKEQEAARAGMMEMATAAGKAAPALTAITGGAANAA